MVRGATFRTVAGSSRRVGESIACPSGVSRLVFGRFLAPLLALAFLLTGTPAQSKKHKEKHRDADDDDDDAAADVMAEPPLAALAPGFERAPYLQSLGRDSVLVVWIASAAGTPALDYGTSSEYGTTVQATSDGARRAAALRHLTPGTRYFYRVRAGERVLAAGPDLTFRTDAGPGDRSFAFFVTGDIGEASGKQRTTEGSILRSDARPAFGLLCGDIVYGRGRSQDYDLHLMRPWSELLSRLPVWPALGNHDWGSDPETNWRREWYLPNNEHYYSFDYGDAHFVALDTRDGELYDGAHQMRWLRDDLREHANAGWLFVYFHHPGITCTYKENTQAVVDSLMPLFDRFHVDVVFNGHAHTYERLYPLKDGKPVDVQEDPSYTDPTGTMYIVTGAGSKVQKKHPTERCGPTAAFKDRTILWTLVHLDGPRCTIVAVVSDDDRVLDTVTLTKTLLVRAGKSVGED